MTLFNLLRQWRIRSQRPERTAGDRYLSAARLQAAIDRERMRADRIGGMFSFVYVHCPEGLDEALCPLIESLAVRLRLTDDFGSWQQGLGILLPETSPDSARQLIETACSQCNFNSMPSWQITVYPPRTQSDGLRPMAEVTGAADLGLPDAHAAGVVPEFSSADHALAVEQLFARPLPLWKRTIDIVAATAGLLVLSPVLLVAAVAIKASSPGPVLFTQRRSGLAGRPFTIYKLRTMRVDAEEMKDQLRPLSEQDGPAFKLKDDPRTTRIGRYLRKTCIDELPQLLNVLRGDMTLVGPRPLPCDESAACLDWQRQRLDVTPGLTCSWQVRSGRSRIAFADWMRLDIRYKRSRSVTEDMRLLWKTFVAVLLHRASH